MADVFGKHQPKIPYQPIAASAGAVSRARSSRQARHRGSRPEHVGSLRALERAVADIGAALKQKGVGKGGRVLLPPMRRWRLR